MVSKKPKSKSASATKNKVSSGKISLVKGTSKKQASKKSLSRSTGEPPRSRSKSGTRNDTKKSRRRSKIPVLGSQQRLISDSFATATNAHHASGKISRKKVLQLKIGFIEAFKVNR